MRAGANCLLLADMTSETGRFARIVTIGALAAAVSIGGAAGNAAAAPATAPQSDRSAHGTHGTQQTPQRAAQGGWTGPLTGGYRISRGYGVKGDYAGGRHTGVDLAVPVGTTVRSVGSGRVVFAGRSGDYGKAVTVHMADGKYTLFAHLSKIGVRKGDWVSAGSYLGKSGNTGRSSGPHLHFEVRAERGYGSDINPVAYLARKGISLT